MDTQKNQNPDATGQSRDKKLAPVGRWLLPTRKQLIRALITGRLSLPQALAA